MNSATIKDGLRVNVFMPKKKKCYLCLFESFVIYMYHLRAKKSVHDENMKMDMVFFFKVRNAILRKIPKYRANSHHSQSFLFMLALLCYMFLLVRTAIFRQKDVKQIPDDSGVRGPQHYKKSVVIGECFFPTCGTVHLAGNSNMYYFVKNVLLRCTVQL